jgi:hypothetical protein
MHSSAETGNPRSARRWLVAVAILALLVAGGMTVFLNSKGHKESINKRSSERFGEALERAGIRTQAGPSK